MGVWRLLVSGYMGDMVANHGGCGGSINGSWLSGLTVMCIR